MTLPLLSVTVTSPTQFLREDVRIRALAVMYSASIQAFINEMVPN